MKVLLAFILALTTYEVAAFYVGSCYEELWVQQVNNWGNPRLAGTSATWHLRYELKDSTLKTLTSVCGKLETEIHDGYTISHILHKYNKFVLHTDVKKYQVQHNKIIDANLDDGKKIVKNILFGIDADIRNEYRTHHSETYETSPSYSIYFYLNKDVMAYYECTDRLNAKNKDKPDRRFIYTQDKDFDLTNHDALKIAKPGSVGEANRFEGELHKISKEHIEICDKIPLRKDIP